MEQVKGIEFVELEMKQTGQRKAFRLDHAQALLCYERNDIKVECWIVPADSNYIFENGKLNQRGGPRQNKGAQKRKGDQPGETKEDEAPTTHGGGDGHAIPE